MMTRINRTIKIAPIHFKHTERQPKLFYCNFNKNSSKHQTEINFMPTKINKCITKIAVNKYISIIK